MAVVDPWPGDAQTGQALLSAQKELFDTTQQSGVNPSVMPHPARCLRDLRAVGTEAAKLKAVELIAAGITQLDEWQEVSWEPSLLGERLSAWIGFYDFYASVAPPEFHERLIISLVRQLRHLLRVPTNHLTGLARLRVIKGLLYGGLGLLEGERALEAAQELLMQQLTTEILPDGGHISRNPSVQLHALRYLIDIRTALQSERLELPPELTMSIERMVPALKMFRHGDGGLALFNGSNEESGLWIDAAITLAEARGRVMRRLPQTGYERITSGRSLLLVDLGAPPPHPFDAEAHAGLLSFEFSVGRERLIVNCGTAPAGQDEWRQALAATAAHSTLTLEDTNACGILSDGLGHRPHEVSGQRFEQDGTQSVEMMHDGYVNHFRVLHHRTLSLLPEGEELCGREVLAGEPGHNFSLRWHLHAAVRASLAHGGQTALLRTPSGAGWRLRATGGDLGLESSIYCGGDMPRRSLQLKLSGSMRSDPTVIEWTLTREKKS